MSSPHASLSKGKKMPLAPGERAAPFRHSSSTGDVTNKMLELDYHASRVSKVPSSCKGPSDSELMGSMMNRLRQVETELAEAQMRAKEKEKRIHILEEKCALYEKANGSSYKQELERKCRKLQKTIHEMEEDLLEASEEVIHEDDLRQVQGSSTATQGFQMDFDLVLRNIKELNMIAGDGEHVIRHTKDGARLEIKESVPVTLYENGIFMFGGPFRSYHEVETQQCMQDIMDGYFPTELQSRYPDGVPFQVTDLRSTIFHDRRREKLFPGEGQVLSPEKLPIHGDDSEKKNVALSLLDREADVTEDPPKSHHLSVDQFLSKLPSSVVRHGKIVDVRSGVESLLKGEKVASEVVIIETKAVEEMKIRMATEERRRPPTPCNIATLRIKSDSGDQTYVLKMKFSDTIRDVRKYINERRPKGLPAYDIKSSFPNKVYDDQDSTLLECKLTPNATLHIIARKR